jgi:hypothetical protein
MTPDWNTITDIIHAKLKASGFRVKMFDEDMQPTFELEKARHFYARSSSANDPDIKNYKIVINLHDENANSHVDLETPKFQDSVDFNNMFALQKYFVKNLQQKLKVSVNWHQFDHDISPREPVAESADISRPWGTTKSSFQKVGNCRLIVRHTDAVNEAVPGSRWRKIHKVFVETNQGERFAFPVPHVKGARALARHISEGGTSHDDVGMHIKALSEDLHHLKTASRRLRGAAQTDANLTEFLAQLNQQMHGINQELQTWSGPRGYHKMIGRHDDRHQTTSAGLPAWLLATAESCCGDQVPTLQKYYQGATSPAPELDEFQDWLVSEEMTDPLTDIHDDETAAHDLARSSYQDYSHEEDGPEHALKSTLTFLIGSNDWWRQQWEQDPDHTQQQLKDLVQPQDEELDPDLDRMKTLAGM